MWSKFDDQFYLNPKNCTMDRDEQDLYFAGIIYCNGQLTDGFIPGGVLQMLCIWAKIPIEASAQAIARRLVEHNFWEICDNGYMVHNFLDWNLSKEQVTELRQARSEAGKRGGNKSQARHQASAQANAKQNSTLSLSHIPVPKKEEEDAPAAAVEPQNNAYIWTTVTNQMYIPAKDLTMRTSILDTIQIIRDKFGGNAQEAIDYLKPYWQSWKERKTKDGAAVSTTNPAWLLEWSVAGEIPVNKKEVAVQQKAASIPVIMRTEPDPTCQVCKGAGQYNNGKRWIKCNCVKERSNGQNKQTA